MEKPGVTIVYCPRCGWLFRATWMAQELLTTFTGELSGVTLSPAENSGDFSIRVGSDLVWDRREDGGFPDIKVLKQKVRDIAAPGKSLGHSDR